MNLMHGRQADTGKTRLRSEGKLDGAQTHYFRQNVSSKIFNSADSPAHLIEFRLLKIDESNFNTRSYY
jgi:hypothetical protein